MFYSHFLYLKQGPLAKVWLASHMIRKLDTKDIRNTDIKLSADAFTNMKVPLALRLCGQLLYGLARIYQQKVNLASEEADQVLRKINSLLSAERTAPGSARKARRRTGAGTDRDSSRIELDREELRARDSAITLPEDLIDGRRDRGYASLGRGLAAWEEEMDLDQMLADPDFDLQGEEADEFLQKALGADDQGHHMAINLETGEVQLNPSQWEVDAHEMSLPMGLDSGEELGLEGADTPFPMEELSAPPTPRSATSFQVEGGRDASRNFEADVSELDISMQRDGKMGSGFSLDLDEGLGAGGDMYGEDEMGMPVDGDVDAASAAVDQLLDESHAELSELLRKKREDARAKRAAKKAALAAAAAASAVGGRRRHAHAVEVHMDSVTEIPGKTIMTWLNDTSDITNTDRQVLTRPKDAMEGMSELSQQVAHRHPAKRGATQAPGAAHVFDLPATGLGGAAYASFTPEVQHSRMQRDMGVYGSKLMDLMRSRMTHEQQLPHLRYGHVDEAAVAASVQQAASIASGLVDEAGLSGIGMDESMDFGGGGGVGGDFEPIIDEPLVDEYDQQPEVEGEEQDMQMEEEFVHDAVSVHDEQHSHIDAAEFAADELDASQSRERETLHNVSAFWGERDTSIAAGERELKESVESGWSKRTKKMHQLLAEEFKKQAGQALSFDKLVEGHVRPVAAGSFYQLLVLASGGFLSLQQPASYADILLSKTNTFDSRRLPRVPDSSGSGSASASGSGSQMSATY